MADAAQIGANFSNYTGDAALGGSNAQAFKIDTRPLELLAQYTFHYKKAQWEQHQADIDAKVKELADAGNISLNDLRGKDKEYMTKKLSEYTSYLSEFARKTPTTTEEKLEQQLEYQNHRRDIWNDYDSGKARAVSYYAHLNTIKQKITDATTQDEAIRQLNKEFDNTDIATQISATPNFKIEKFDLPEPTSQKFNSVAILGNENVSIKGSIYNPKLNAGIADAAILGISKAYPKQGTKEYDALSENEKNQAAIQSTIESSGKGWVDATEPLNKALKNYIKDGKFDADSFETDNASNTTLMNAYNALKKYDSDNRDRYNQAINGFFTDKGINIPLPPNVNPNDFKVGFVDFAKGVNANQLVQSGMYAKHTGDTFDKTITETDNAIQRANISQNYAQLNETIRHNKATENLASEDNARLLEQWKASQTGGTTQVNGAMERAKRIYKDMLKLADKNGVITPEKIRQLNVEQLKYLGIEVPQERDSEGKIITQGGFKPLTFTEGEGEDKKSVPHAIQLINGEIRVLKNATLSETGSGSYKGEFDPTKSTNIYNVGTNILNEELKNAGSKELNSYFGVDITGTPVITSEGGTQTKSGKQVILTKEQIEFKKKYGIK